jgi:hypothetical protein
MKALKIFGLCFALFALLSIGTFVNLVSAADIQTDITGHTYVVRIDGALYNLTFKQGYFGPGPTGEVDLSQDGVFIAKYDFTSRGDLLTITDLGKFFYGNYQLVYIPGSSVLLLNCRDCSTQ